MSTGVEIAIGGAFLRETVCIQAAAVIDYRTRTRTRTRARARTRARMHNNVLNINNNKRSLLFNNVKE